MSLDENQRWLLSYYRSSEMGGALLFGRLARIIPAGPVQHDMTKHFADEAQHAWYWTDCLDQLGVTPLRLQETYQDRYLEAAGAPANLMEVLAITSVFERRVISQYAHHRAVPGLAAPITATIGRIMEDERWHIRWVSDALAALETQYGAATVAATLQRCKAADAEVYAATLAEHGERLAFITGRARGERHAGTH
jgi:hypothetical protein